MPCFTIVKCYYFLIRFAIICYHLLSFVADSAFLPFLGKILYICRIMKNDYDISKQFQDDLIKAYNKVAPHCWLQSDAYKKAVKQPAPRYYVSAKQAGQVLSPMVRGDFSRVDAMQPNKRRMYYSLMEKVLELSEKRAFVGKSLIYIVSFAVTSPAPEFFVGHEAMRKIRSDIKNCHLDDSGRRVFTPCRARSYEKLKAKRERIRAFKSSLLS